MNWFELSNAHEVDTPALIVFPHRVKKNINILKTILPDVTRLRPHVKTHKSPQVTQLLIQAGFTQFKCATIAEAEMLGEAHAQDVLLAYQPVGPKAERLAALAARFPSTKFSCLVDNETVALRLNDIFKKIGRRLTVYLDLNIGMNRTGIKPGPEAESLYRKLQSLENIVPEGLHAYDGHLRDSDLALRTKKCNEGFEPVLEMQRNLTGKVTIVVGGTTTFPIHAGRKDVVCSPGTFIYWDHGYQDTFKEQPFEFAAVVITRVISKPETNLICIDLGHKSIASENPLSKRIFFLNADDLEPTGHSEEHMVLRVRGSNHYNIGDVLYSIPFHICPTVALYESVVVASENKAVDRWINVARNRKITI